MAPTVSAVPKRSPIWAQPNQKNAAPAKIAPLIAQSLGRSPTRRCRPTPPARSCRPAGRCPWRCRCSCPLLRSLRRKLCVANLRRFVAQSQSERQSRVREEFPFESAGLAMATDLANTRGCVVRTRWSARPCRVGRRSPSTCRGDLHLHPTPALPAVARGSRASRRSQRSWSPPAQSASPHRPQYAAEPASSGSGEVGVGASQRHTKSGGEKGSEGLVEGADRHPRSSRRARSSWGPVPGSSGSCRR